MKSLLIQKVRWKGRLMKRYNFFLIVHSKYTVNLIELWVSSCAAFLWIHALMNGGQCFVIKQSFPCKQFILPTSLFFLAIYLLEEESSDFIKVNYFFTSSL